MDTRYVKEFLVFAAELNYSTAAKKLFITRPTLSDHIRELEEELGCELVGKRQGKAALTPAGRRFVQTGTQLVETVQGIVDEYRSLADNLLTVTVAQTNLPWLESLLYKTRHAVQEHHPGKRIDIVTASGPRSTVDALREQQNDIVVAGCKSYVSGTDRRVLPQGVQGFKLCTEEIKLLMTQDNPLFGAETVYAADLDGATIMLPPDIYHGYLRDGVVDRFAAYGAHVNLQTMSFSDHFEYFSYDFQDLFGVVPTTLAPRFGIEERDECRAFSLADLPFETDFYAAYTDEFASSENGCIFIDEMKRIVAADDHEECIKTRTNVSRETSRYVNVSASSPTISSDAEKRSSAV
ncbi:LysR family transcriptional regulator [Raoultibacter phocaeensis]|uniref:LysR family transcriptional regulator n=1 Tax=Raoultibacter phocaeensis TaxID=2479841 RepID=UPI001119A2CF|nr:LysR family transcriptional regulator [Raoultibacter phocaeensis]